MIDVSHCLADEELAAWQAGFLSEIERCDAIAHTAACSRCRVLLCEVIRNDSSDGDGDDRVGRYEVLETLGSGGMGVVLRAYDPFLNREVAVKICRRASEEPLEKEVLFAEARKLALVRHQNVVPVYDVGSQGNDIYIAMELVAGVSLAEWAAEPRSVEQRLAIARDVGHGLVSIHCAGLVHRDLKPSNVMVRQDGSAVIVDLGLAEFHDPVISSQLPTAGTKGYLSPEVESGAIATPLSDQYQWLALLREPLGLKTDLPWVARFLERGLAQNPTERFESVSDALSAIQTATEPRRRHRLGVSLALIGALALAAGFVLWYQADSSVPNKCSTVIHWESETKKKIADNVRLYSLPADAVVQFLETRATLAQTLARGFCEAAEGDDDLAWRRHECVVSAWRATDGPIVDLRDGVHSRVLAAIDNLAALLPLERCERGTVLAIPAPLTKSENEALDVAHAELDAIMSDQKLTSSEKRKQLAALQQRLAVLGPAGSSAWRQASASLYTAQADRTKAAEEYAAIYRIATEAGADELAAQALVNQLLVLPPSASTDAVDQLVAHARASVERLGNPYWRAQLSGAIANLADARGDFKTSISMFRTGIKKLEALRLSPHHFELSMMQNLGATLVDAGDPTAASELLKQAVKHAEVRWAVVEPIEYWALRTGYATALLASEKTDEALAELLVVAEGLEAIEASAYERGIVQSFLAAAFSKQGRPSEARLVAERAVELVQEDTGESVALVWPLTSAAQIAQKATDWAVSKKHLVRALAICNGGSCREIEVVLVKSHLAIALKRTGDRGQGMALAREVMVPLKQPGLEKTRADLAAEFPNL